MATTTPQARQRHRGAAKDNGGKKKFATPKHTATSMLALESSSLWALATVLVIATLLLVVAHTPTARAARDVKEVDAAASLTEDAATQEPALDQQQQEATSEGTPQQDAEAAAVDEPQQAQQEAAAAAAAHEEDPPGTCPEDCNAHESWGKCRQGRCVCTLGRGGPACTFSLDSVSRAPCVRFDPRDGPERCRSAGLVPRCFSV